MQCGHRATAVSKIPERRETEPRVDGGQAPAQEDPERGGSGLREFGVGGAWEARTWG